MMWFTNPVKKAEYEEMNTLNCWYNKYPKANSIAFKDIFGDMVNGMKEIFPQDFDFDPRSFILPADNEEFEDYCEDNKN